MAIALTPFKGFCGFLPLPHLLLLLTSIPEMQSLIGSPAIQTLATSMGLNSDILENKEELKSLAEGYKVGKDEKEISEKEKKALKGVFEILMKSDQSKITQALKSLLSRYSSSNPNAQSSYEESLIDLVKMLNEQYPDDVGVLCCFILNVVELKVGEAVFLKADEPHAYISGGELKVDCTGDWI